MTSRGLFSVFDFGEFSTLFEKSLEFKQHICHLGVYLTKGDLAKLIIKVLFSLTIGSVREIKR